ncbi:MAG: hypothetical protein ABWY80_05525 [Acidimicrobiia bacterium]
MPRAAREWVTFVDPREAGRTWQIDITFLLSNWRCIFGDGCQGVLDAPAPELVLGCCSYGAHFSDRADRALVMRASKRLRDDEWQFAKLGRKKGIFEKAGKDDDGVMEYKTRLADDACIFLNRIDFAAGPGCALHLHAMRTGVHHSELKPEVCWQLPLRRIDEEQEDGTVITTLTEFGREGWGEGGDDFAWWCTEAPEAFSAPEPVYESMSAELRKMLGKRLFRSLVEYLESRAADGVFPPVAHPAVPVSITKKPGAKPSSAKRRKAKAGQR